ncbi:methyltransferase domain-containing protein [Streptomyces brasiliensis]|uniref:Protein-L-isoaspartate O-methyltransferase n=1 Tax=Streptomyces brasiliensis TaxID=1954 RepID=A0A917LB19_9ACTN|nr:methyltransferase domain-containing protein [Streptomyces brasiliensis]GGJ56571.1 protein-L-isoaspartate O-methyltransferase [Streptomyces brasiliensis]
MIWNTHAAHLADEATDDGSRWRPLVANTPRHVFVPRWWERQDGTWTLCAPRPDNEAWLHGAYRDRSLITRVGPLHADHAGPDDHPEGRPTSSATLPSLVVQMFQHGRLQDGQDLLEVGTGSGYGTALAAKRLGENRVTSLDVDPYLIDAARDRLGSLGLKPTLAAVDATGPIDGEYDRIMATVGVRPVPPSWLGALRTGGRLVATIAGTSLIIEAVKRFDGTAYGRIAWERAGFMPTRTGDDYAPLPDGLLEAAKTGEGEAVTEGQFPVLDVGEAWDVASMLELLAPGVQTGYSQDANGTRTAWMAHPDGSWARAVARGTAAPLVHQSGPQRLWDVLDGIRSYWLEHGELPVRGARVLITPDGRTRLARGDWRVTL